MGRPRILSPEPEGGLIGSLTLQTAASPSQGLSLFGLPECTQIREESFRWFLGCATSGAVIRLFFFHILLCFPIFPYTFFHLFWVNNCPIPTSFCWMFYFLLYNFYGYFFHPHNFLIWDFFFPNTPIFSYFFRYLISRSDFWDVVIYFPVTVFPPQTKQFVSRLSIFYQISWNTAIFWFLIFFFRFCSFCQNVTPAPTLLLMLHL